VFESDLETSTVRLRSTRGWIATIKKYSHMTRTDYFPILNGLIFIVEMVCVECAVELQSDMESVFFKELRQEYRKQEI
jgi:hypothetical protein